MDIGAERSRVPGWRGGRTKVGRGQGGVPGAGWGRVILWFRSCLGRIKRIVLCVRMDAVVSGAGRSLEREMGSSRSGCRPVPGWKRAEVGAGPERGGAVEGHGNGVVPGRVLGGKEGEPRVREARRVLGGPGAGAKRVPVVERRSRGGG